MKNKNVTDKTLTSYKFRKVRFFLLAISCLASSSAFADEPSVSISLASDSVQHGISFSNEKPALGLTYDQNLGESFFLGSGINVHQTSGIYERRGWSHLYAGFFKPIKEEVTVFLSVNRYAFHADFPVSWDYSELRADLSLPYSFGISYSYSDSYYGRGNSSQRFEINWNHHFNEDYTFSAAAGLSMPDWFEYFEDFYDSRLSITRHFDRSRLNLSYHYVEDQVELVHGSENIEPRFTIIFEWDLY